MDRRTRLRRLLIAVPVIVALAWLIGGFGGEDDGDPGSGGATPAVQPADAP